MLPVLTGGAAGRTSMVHHSVNGSFALRAGDWKLCLCPGSGGWSAPRPGLDDTSTLPAVQLFDMSQDIGETTNLAAKRADRVKDLTMMLDLQVKEGRSTPGQPQKNAVDVDVTAAGVAAMKPLKAKGKP